MLTTPTSTGDIPERRREMVIAKIMPVKAMFSGAAMTSRARRNGLPSRNRSPWTPADPAPAAGADRGCCIGWRMHSTATSDSRKVRALPTNGSARPSPNSRPPSGGPASEVP